MLKVSLRNSLFLTLLLTGCGATDKSPEAVHQAVPPGVPRSRNADDTARFLAGLPGEPGSPFAELEMDPAWQAHRASLDAAWGKTETGLLSRLRVFVKQELSSADWAAPVFYPFGGPDSLNVTQLFPRSPAYSIIALEPPGTLPSLAQFQKMDLSVYLAETRATMASVLGKSFFVTREMDKQFRGQITDGLLLPILESLVRTGHRILGFRYVRLDGEGKIVERSVSYVSPTKFGDKGVEVEFETAADKSIHRLYYFSLNLADDHLKENKPFMSYVSGLTGVTTYLKATSYMTHNKNFSIIRDAVLEHSGRVLQEDSGIPYASFLPELWNIQLYGQYTRPYGSFNWREQKDLQAAYAAGGVKPLALRLGYGFGRVDSNRLLARREQ